MNEAEQRYENFIAATREGAEVWVLSDGESFALLNSDGEECLPLWADADSARAWSTDDTLAPRAVPMDAWFDRWVPGLDGDQIQVAVNPGESGDTVVLSAGELAAAMQASRG